MKLAAALRMRLWQALKLCLLQTDRITGLEVLTDQTN